MSHISWHIWSSKSIWQIPLKMSPPRKPPNPEPQISLYNIQMGARQAKGLYRALAPEPAARHRGRTTGPTDSSEPDFPVYFPLSLSNFPLCLKSERRPISCLISNRTSRLGRRAMSDRTSASDVRFEIAVVCRRPNQNLNLNLYHKILRNLSFWI